ncbi:dihydroorotate dehydrogenase-like protein [bacterium]|jgi:dihydroorotate dehydrogenase (fumarate)|nr:dihydroorotate dehydrogenase-like protein [bacterium]
MDLSTTYLGLNLKHPIMSSASPLAQNLAGVKKLEDAGVAAIILPSLFEEQIEKELLELHWATLQGSESFAEATSYFPSPEKFILGPEEYLSLISKAKESCSVPVIPSLNGIAPGSWAKYARFFEEAGAPAIELNIYYVATDPFADSAKLEENYLEIIREVRSHVNIPLAVKVSPFFTTFASMARRCVEAGADGLVLFNRFYQPDLDLEQLEVKPHVELSTSFAMRLPLRWVAILYGRVPCDFATTSGVHSGEDAVKLIMAGANTVMMCSALYKNGLGHVNAVLKDMKGWMEVNEYDSVDMMRGTMSQVSVANPDAYERANYMKTLQSFRMVP